MDTKRRKIIMDVDTGSDDACALIAAAMSPELELMAICTVNGNREVKLTTLNTLRVAELLGIDNVPVYKGCAYPMVACLDGGIRKPNIPWREGKMTGIASLIHGDHLPLPGPNYRHEEELNAVSYYVKTLKNSDEKITLVPVGPLTNIAMAMRIDPTICENIDEIMIMGGGDRVANHGPMAEYNVWVDPEAGEVVMFYAEKYDIKLTWVPLDATHEAILTVNDAAELRSYHTPVADAVASFVEQRTKGYSNYDNMNAVAGAPIHDALAVLALIDPDVLVDVKHVNIHVDFGGGPADGATCVDHRQSSEAGKPNCYFAYHANSKKFAEMLKAIIKRNVVYSK